MRWADVIALPIFLELDANFKAALIPDPHHVVKSGFLFSIEIYLFLLETFRLNTHNDLKDQSAPSLGSYRSRKSDVLDSIVYPALQARSPRCDLGIFKKGIDNVCRGQLPERIDFSPGASEELLEIDSTAFYGFFGNKYTRTVSASPAIRFPTMAMATSRFESLHQAKTAVIAEPPAQAESAVPRKRCAIM